MASEGSRQDVWSFWGTLLWGLLIGVLFVGIQVAVVGIYVSMTEPGSEQAYQRAVGDGDVLAWATIASASLCTLLTWVAVAAKRGRGLRDYLGLYPVVARQVAVWTGLFILLLIALEILSSLLDRPVTPDVMRDIYASSDSKLLLFLATVIFAPIFEELFFRGFIMEGFRHSFIGSSGSVVLSAAFWAVVHVQYDYYGIITIFIIGVFLGLAKLRSGSTFFAMALHALNNGIAFLFLMLASN